MNFQYITLKQRPHVWIPQNVVKLTMLHLFNSHWSVVDQFSILSTCTESLLQSQEISVDPKRVLFASLASAAKTQQRWLLLRCSCSYLNNQDALMLMKTVFPSWPPILTWTTTIHSRLEQSICQCHWTKAESWLTPGASAFWNRQLWDCHHKWNRNGFQGN